MLLCGSVARGWADRWSDVEVLVCWTAVPPPAARARLAGEAGGARLVAWPPDPKLGIGEEAFVRDGIKVELLHAPVGAIESVLDAVTLRADPSLRKHVLVAAIRDAAALAAGTGRLPAWQARAVVYPAALQAAMIERNLVFGPHWWLRMLAARGDVLALNQVLCRVVDSVLGLALALNRTYAVSNDGKWALRAASTLAIAPADVVARSTRVLSQPPLDAAEEAIALIDESLALVARHAPGPAVERAIARVAQPRAGS